MVFVNQGELVILSEAKDPVVKGKQKLKSYAVYILASRSRTLYIGVTNDLMRRMYEHKHKLMPGFTAKFNIDRLVYYEQTEDVNAAIAREKSLKGWRRSRKIEFIESTNPGWEDLSDGWFE